MYQRIRVLAALWEELSLVPTPTPRGLTTSVTPILWDCGAFWPLHSTHTHVAYRHMHINKITPQPPAFAFPDPCSISHSIFFYTSDVCTTHLLNHLLWRPYHKFRSSLGHFSRRIVILEKMVAPLGHQRWHISVQQQAHFRVDDSLGFPALVTKYSCKINWRGRGAILAHSSRHSPPWRGVKASGVWST